MPVSGSTFCLLDCCSLPYTVRLSQPRDADVLLQDRELEPFHRVRRPHVYVVTRHALHAVQRQAGRRADTELPVAQGDADLAFAVAALLPVPEL